MSTLSLRDDIAATLQARMSWPQADACATDVVGRFGRRMRDFPLTCEFCRQAPATHLFVADIRDEHTRKFICDQCAERDTGRAAEIAKSPASAWLFALVPAGEVGNEEGR